MGILIAAWGTDLDELRGAWERHIEHLRMIRDRLPAGAREFAEAPWHYDPQDPRCPHDAWVEHVLIAEPARGERRQRRRIDIEVRLLGAYHDGHLTLRYRNVVAYQLEQPNRVEDRTFRRWVGHGDWLTDDVGLSPGGFVTHEVLFSWGGAWSLECEELTYQWQPGGFGPEVSDVEEGVPNRLGDLPEAAT